MSEKDSREISVFESGDGYDYEIWDSALEQEFNLLGVVRTLEEGDFTSEEKQGIVLAIKRVFLDLNSDLPHQIPCLEGILNGLANSDTFKIRELLDFLGTAIRSAAQNIRSKAPSRAVREAKDLKNHRDDNDPNFIHWWLDQKEIMVLARHLADLKSLFEAIKSGEKCNEEILAWDIFSAFGDLQRLFILVKKLSSKIDNEEIDVSLLKGWSSEDCLSQIKTAKEMFLRAVRARKADSKTSVPFFDLSQIDSKILDNVITIASCLSPVKMQSV